MIYSLSAFLNQSDVISPSTQAHAPGMRKTRASQALTSMKEITETTKVTVGQERDAHADCRTKEMKTHADMVAKCTALKDFLKQLESLPVGA